ncbi:hypothetical protein DES43_10579 [Aquamicrobium defluvii]|uniref:Uncharacterized protein n=1 Tax=Aquamicrobium defluvii TaxID=69279 RepID=A0A4R6YHZ8_9HYPH|nr:hypothetical protein DES43_10579 [Aquamicrobium defluvii]
MGSKLPRNVKDFASRLRETIVKPEKKSPGPAGALRWMDQAPAFSYNSSTWSQLMRLSTKASRYFGRALR